MQNLFNSIVLKLNYQSLFPFKIKNRNYNNERIFSKYFIFFSAFSERGSLDSQVYKNTPSLFITKKQKQRTTILRSPNRHKIAQFHVSKYIYSINTTLRFKFNVTELSLIYFIKLLKTLSSNLDSSLVYTKKIKIKSLYSLNLN